MKVVQPHRLKLCPFCGGVPVMVTGGPGCSFVQCLDCKAASDDGTEERARESWNKRKDPWTNSNR